MFAQFSFQHNTFVANSAYFSNEIGAPRSILWGAFLITALAIHVNHQIDVVATTTLNMTQKGAKFACRPSFRKIRSPVFLKPLRDNRTND